MCKLLPGFQITHLINDDIIKGIVIIFVIIIVIILRSLWDSKRKPYPVMRNGRESLVYAWAWQDADILSKRAHDSYRVFGQ